MRAVLLLAVALHADPWSMLAERELEPHDRVTASRQRGGGGSAQPAKPVIAPVTTPTRTAPTLNADPDVPAKKSFRDPFRRPGGSRRSSRRRHHVDEWHQ